VSDAADVDRDCRPIIAWAEPDDRAARSGRNGSRQSFSISRERPDALR